MLRLSEWVVIGAGGCASAVVCVPCVFLWWLCLLCAVCVCVCFVLFGLTLPGRLSAGPAGGREGCQRDAGPARLSSSVAARCAAAAAQQRQLYSAAHMSVPCSPACGVSAHHSDSSRVDKVVRHPAVQCGLSKAAASILPPPRSVAQKCSRFSLPVPRASVIGAVGRDLRPPA